MLTTPVNRYCSCVVEIRWGQFRSTFFISTQSSIGRQSRQNVTYLQTWRHTVNSWYNSNSLSLSLCFTSHKSFPFISRNCVRLRAYACDDNWCAQCCTEYVGEIKYREYVAEQTCTEWNLYRNLIRNKEWLIYSILSTRQDRCFSVCTESINF